MTSGRGERPVSTSKEEQNPFSSPAREIVSIPDMLDMIVEF